MGAHEGPGKSVDWFTPRWVFDALDDVFDLDVAAPVEGPRYVPAKAWLSEREDGLKTAWKVPGIHRAYCWMNPPFGHQSTKVRWLTKFFEHGHGIALVPDRTSAPWFQRFAPLATEILFVTPKIKFERPDGTLGEQPGNGTALLAAGQRAFQALERAAAAGIGFVVVPRPVLAPEALQERLWRAELLE
jgi:hypothetical protein